MPAKRGIKRKAPATNGDTAGTPSPPDRDTWQGWVEMESEPVCIDRGRFRVTDADIVTGVLQCDAEGHGCPRSPCARSLRSGR
nr:hypothetical protein CFP56_52723 [Quercus suber]